MNYNQLEKAYSALLLDSDFSKLELLNNRPNIFSALKIVHYENRHSNFLGWLLDPKQTHGLGDKFLKWVLSDILHDERVNNISVADIASLNLNNASVYREWNKIDLLIDVADIVVVFENKVWTGEHSNQLIRYRDLIESEFGTRRKVFVFLSPDGHTSSLNDLYINYSYSRIIILLERLVEIYQVGIIPSVLIYLNDYIETIKTHFMANGDANQLARKIYINHKQLLDFVFSHTPNPIQELNRYFTQKVNEMGWIKCTSERQFVRFLTPQLNTVIPRNSHSWKKEAFLFEFHVTDELLEFYYTIAPGDERTRIILKQAIESNPLIENYEEIGEYMCYASLEVEIDLSLNLGDKNFLDDYLKSFWITVIDAVQVTESMILQRRKDLKDIL